jgi:hypothetical protein
MFRDSSLAGNLVVLNNNAFIAAPVSSGTITFGGVTAMQTAGTLSTPAPNWTSAAGTLTLGSGAATLLTGTNVLTLAPNLTSSGATVTGGSAITLLGNGGTWNYTGETTISGGTLKLSNSGTIILLGNNSFGQGDGTIPEPATALLIFVASMTLLLQRSCSFQRA